METVFSINITMHLPRGPETFGRFYIGNDAERAEAIFRQLKGKHDLADQDVLSVELMETNNGLPVNLKVMTCSLTQLGENCKIITKELFKAIQLEGGSSDKI